MTHGNRTPGLEAEGDPRESLIDMGWDVVPATGAVGSGAAGEAEPIALTSDFSGSALLDGTEPVAQGSAESEPELAGSQGASVDSAMGSSAAADTRESPPNSAMQSKDAEPDLFSSMLDADDPPAPAWATRRSDAPPALAPAKPDSSGSLPASASQAHQRGAALEAQPVAGGEPSVAGEAPVSSEVLAPRVLEGGVPVGSSRGLGHAGSTEAVTPTALEERAAESGPRDSIDDRSSDRFEDSGGRGGRSDLELESGSEPLGAESRDTDVSGCLSGPSVVVAPIAFVGEFESDEDEYEVRRRDEDIPTPSGVGCDPGGSADPPVSSGASCREQPLAANGDPPVAGIDRQAGARVDLASGCEVAAETAAGSDLVETAAGSDLVETAAGSDLVEIAAAGGLVERGSVESEGAVRASADDTRGAIAYGDAGRDAPRSAQADGAPVRAAPAAESTPGATVPEVEPSAVVANERESCGAAQAPCVLSGPEAQAPATVEDPRGPQRTFEASTDGTRAANGLEGVGAAAEATGPVVHRAAGEIPDAATLSAASATVDAGPAFPAAVPPGLATQAAAVTDAPVAMNVARVDLGLEDDPFKPTVRRQIPLLAAAGVAIIALGIGALLDAKLRPTHSTAAMVTSAAPRPAQSAPAPPPTLLERAAEGDESAVTELEGIPSGSLGVAQALALAEGRSAIALHRFEAVAREIRQNSRLAEETAIRARLMEAARAPETTMRALETIAGLGSATAADMLYELWTGTSERTPATTTAELLVNSAELRAAASPALKVALDLRASPPEACEEKVEILQRVKTFGDERSALLVNRLLRRFGCGPKGQQDCHACLRGTPLLKEAIRAVRERKAPRF